MLMDHVVWFKQNNDDYNDDDDNLPDRQLDPRKNKHILEVW